MKTCVLVLAFLAASGLSGIARPDGQGQAIAIPPRSSIKIPQQSEIKQSKPNKIHGLRSSVTYSGILVQVAKTDNALQLFNPFAPERYGSGADNMHFDPITRKEAGLKFFSIGF